MTLYYDVFETPFGWMGLLASEAGLRRTTLPRSSPDECADELLTGQVGKAVPAPDRFEGLKEKLEMFFEGSPVSFEDEPIDVYDAAPFHRAAWDACRSIPSGETRSYGWLGASVGSPRAARAAGQSMARNRLPIIIPCHRVIAADGTLGGYGKGKSQLALKQRLLDMEARASR